MVTDTHDRGQMILIGAVAVALLVIGITLSVNAVLFTENVRPAESTSQLSEAREIDYETRRSVRSLTVRVNHRTRDHSEPEITTWVGDNLTRMSHLLEESYVTSGPTAVNVSFDPGPSTNGSRLVQLGDSSFEDGASADWDPLGPNDGTQRLGWAVVNFNTSQSGEERFHANFSNAQGEHVNMTFNKTFVSGTEYEVITESSTGGTTTVECDPQRDRVLLNLFEGRSYSDTGCVFNGTAEIGNVTRVHFEDGDNAVGRYAIVTNDTSALGIGTQCTSGPPASEPCHAPAVWQANVTVGITGDGFQYENRHNVSAYTGGD